MQPSNIVTVPFFLPIESNAHIQNCCHVSISSMVQIVHSRVFVSCQSKCALCSSKATLFESYKTLAKCAVEELPHIGHGL